MNINSRERVRASLFITHLQGLKETLEATLEEKNAVITTR
ncbi:unnamed protein product [Brassica oleracea]